MVRENARQMPCEWHGSPVILGIYPSHRGCSLLADYLPFLRRHLVSPLVSRGQDGIEDVARDMHEYCLVREDWETVGDMTKFKTKAAWGEDPLKGVEGKTKAAFTRRFNKEGVRARVGTMVEEVKRVKGRRGAKGAQEEPPLTEDADRVAEAAMEEEEEEEEEEEVRGWGAWVWRRGEGYRAREECWGVGMHA